MRKYIILGILLICIPLLGGTCSSSGGGSSSSTPTVKPTAFNLTGPNTGSGSSTTPTLFWDDSTGETGYRVEIATDSAFSATSLVYFVLLGQGVVSHTVVQFPLIANMTYYWRVKAQNSAGDTISTPGYQTFITVGATTAVGILDKTFNNPNGFAVHDNAATGNSNDVGTAVTLDSNTPPRIVVAGHSWNGSDYDAVIWRYNADGTLDTANFNTPKGYVVIPGVASEDRAWGIATDSSGNIYITGYVTVGGTKNMAIYKSQPNGNAAVFGTAGLVVDTANGVSEGFRIMVSGSKVYVVGYSSGNQMTIWRYNTDGSPDNNLNSTYFVAFSDANIFESQGRAIQLDGSDNIVVTGYSIEVGTPQGNTHNMTVWRYSSTGFLDTGGFNSAAGPGYVKDPTAATDSEGRGIVLDTGGSIFTCGYRSNGTDRDVALWKITPAGLVDTSFNTTGYVVHNGAGGATANRNDEGNAVMIDPDGKFVVTGYTSSNNNKDMCIWRFKTDGSGLDTDIFNSPQGFVVHNGAAGGTAADEGLGIVVDADGNLVVAGYSTNSGNNTDMCLWRWE